MLGNGERNGELKPPDSKVRAADRQVRALQLRREGKDYRAIAAALEISVSTAYKCVGQALKALVREPARDVVTMELGRLDVLLSRLWPHVDRETPDPKVVDRVLKVMERRAALLGLDAPKGLLVGNLEGKAFKVYGGAFNPEDV